MIVPESIDSGAGRVDVLDVAPAGTLRAAGVLDVASLESIGGGVRDCAGLLIPSSSAMSTLGWLLFAGAVSRTAPRSESGVSFLPNFQEWYPHLKHGKRLIVGEWRRALAACHQQEFFSVICDFSLDSVCDFRIYSK